MKKYIVMESKDGLYEAMSQSFCIKTFLFLPFMLIKVYKNYLFAFCSFIILLLSYMYPIFLLLYVVTAAITAHNHYEIKLQTKIDREPFKFWQIYRGVYANSEGEAILKIVDGK